MKVNKDKVLSRLDSFMRMAAWKGDYILVKFLFQEYLLYSRDSNKLRQTK